LKYDRKNFPKNLFDESYPGCLHCQEIKGRCIFHSEKKGYREKWEFWDQIRSIKPRDYSGFIFPEYEPYKFISETTILQEASNFWDANEEPIFDHEVYFDNCVFENMGFVKTSFKGEVRFRNCKANSISFLHANFADDYPLEFTNNNAQIFSFHSCNLSINNRHKISFLSNDISTIEINGCKFNCEINIEKHKDLNLQFEYNVLSSVKIYYSSINDLTSRESYIKKLSIDHTYSKKVSSFYDFIENIQLVDNDIEVFEVISLIGSLGSIKNTFKNSFTLQRMRISDIGSCHWNQYIEKIENAITLIRTTISKDCIFTIRDFVFKKVHIQYFNTFSDQVLFYRFSIVDKFELINSNMSKVQFHTVRIAYDCEVLIEGSNLADSVFNDMKWGNISKIKANKDTFRQLKHANDKQSNFLVAHEFYSKEMDEYSKTINAENWEDRVLFFLGKYISNFSRSWGMPLCWVMLSGIIFYSLTVFNLSSFLIINLFGWILLIVFLTFNEWKPQKLPRFLYISTFIAFVIFSFSDQTFNSLANFMNPFIGFLKSESNSSQPQTALHSFVWLLHKIISSFFIYHFVVALRRSTQR
jgi:hypothetical protein